MAGYDERRCALSGFIVTPAPESGDKLTRFGPFSSQCRVVNVKIRRGSWNEELFRVLEGFPDLAHDDEVDACSGALEMLNPQMRQIVRANSGAAAVQLDLFFAANHSIDPGWGTL